jgi:hypothetical protein
MVVQEGNEQDTPMLLPVTASHRKKMLDPLERLEHNSNRSTLPLPVPCYASRAGTCYSPPQLNDKQHAPTPHEGSIDGILLGGSLDCRLRATGRRNMLVGNQDSTLTLSKTRWCPQ